MGREWRRPTRRCRRERVSPDARLLAQPGHGGSQRVEAFVVAGLGSARLEHLRGIALGCCNPTHYIIRTLIHSVHLEDYLAATT